MSRGDAGAPTGVGFIAAALGGTEAGRSAVPLARVASAVCTAPPTCWLGRVPARAFAYTPDTDMQVTPSGAEQANLDLASKPEAAHPASTVEERIARTSRLMIHSVRTASGWDVARVARLARLRGTGGARSLNGIPIGHQVTRMSCARGVELVRAALFDRVLGMAWLIVWSSLAWRDPERRGRRPASLKFGRQNGRRASCGRRR